VTLLISPPTALPAVKRELAHVRQVRCEGYSRDDGLWDIEASMRDVRSGDTVDAAGVLRLKGGDPLHQMGISVTVDADLRIVAAKALTERAPTSACPGAASLYDSLVGLTIGRGFLTEVKRRFKGGDGCTHLTELLGTVATTTIQTLWPLIERKQRDSFAKEAALASPKPPSLLNSCYAFRRDGEIVKVKWPQFYKDVRATT